MRISVRNAKDPTLIKLLKMACKYYASILMSKQLIKNLDISIYVHNTLDAGGFCYSIDDGRKQRTFNIELCRTKKKLNMLRILAHEMVHVKQYAKNELRETSHRRRPVTSWYGVIYDHNIFYWDQPWEIEAYGHENRLLVKFLLEYNQFKELKVNKKNWFIEDDNQN